jgi:hypothetical protein
MVTLCLKNTKALVQCHTSEGSERPNFSRGGGWVCKRRENARIPPTRYRDGPQYDTKNYLPDAPTPAQARFRASLGVSAARSYQRSRNGVYGPEYTNSAFERLLLLRHLLLTLRRGGTPQGQLVSLHVSSANMIARPLCPGAFAEVY